MKNTLTSLHPYLWCFAVFLGGCSNRHAAKDSKVPGAKLVSEAPPVDKKLSYLEYVSLWLEEKVSYVDWNKRIPASPSRYNLNGRCDGYPRVDVKTAPGFCLGLIDDGEGTSMPRWALALNDNAVVVTDMVNWEPNQGRIYLLRRDSAGAWSRKTLFDKNTFKGDKNRLPIIDRPNQISLSPDRKVFVGSASGIMTFDPLAANPKDTVKTVIGNLPSLGLHPLKSFTFDEKKNIYINIGSDSNVCQKSGLQGEKKKSCPESDGNDQNSRGLVRRYEPDGKGGYKSSFVIFARGMRNSVALAFDPVTQKVLEADNGRDAIDRFDKSLKGPELPHEELNILENGKHYGWPYCYDNNKQSPEWSRNCKDFAPPSTLWPAHSAPLSMLVYRGKMFPQAYYRNSLIVALHGYEKYGHRLGVVFRDPKSGFPSGKIFSVVYGWNAKGAQAMGSPVGVSPMSDGSLLIVEDKSKKVLRLFYDPREGDGRPVDESGNVVAEPPVDDAATVERKRLGLDQRVTSANPPLFAQIQKQIIDRQCIVCHGGAAFPGVQLLQHDDIGNEAMLLDLGKAKEFLDRIKGADGRQMPPSGFPSEEEKRQAVDLVQRWYDERLAQ